MSNGVGPEVAELAVVLGDGELAVMLAQAPGGWRDLSASELQGLGLQAEEQQRVISLQKLVRHGYPELSRHKLLNAEDVGRVYGERLGSLIDEVMLVIALDNKTHVIAEAQVASGGKHGMVLTPGDVLRPLIRAGAASFVMVHNHPSGCPEPSQDDIEMTAALAAAADIVGIPLVDHIIVAARGGGFTSLYDLGYINPITENRNEQRAADQAL